MARLQILNLPPRPGHPAPFALIVDQTDRDDIEDSNAFENEARHVRALLGAEAVVFFAFTVDVVNSQQTASPQRQEVFLEFQGAPGDSISDELLFKAKS